ncbi:hypothetical protein [Bradyrhizobium prioriisuperbiae]|uniref:hypothetical protein n=1 Tax=Bradyrhizobium prioriisuperbiae TaxID=2854389 RepID=UPI0028F0C0FB|nr:hypothetical protein [Bradyrhizobium prioritasuperba]
MGTAKLPLRDTITHAYSSYMEYSSYVENFSDVLRISWLWLAIIVPLSIVGSWMEVSGIAGVTNRLTPGTHLESSPGTTAVSLILTLIVALAAISIAVAWHRRLILGESPRASGSNLISNSLWRYLGAGVLITLIAILPSIIAIAAVFLLTSSHRAGDGASLIVSLVPFLLWMVTYGIALRLSLVLPARAVTNLTLSFKQAWADTRGNTWRLFWGTVACAFLPLCVLPILLALVEAYNPNSFTAGSAVVIDTLSTFYTLLVLPIGIGFLSFAYRHFVGPVSRAARPEG